MNNLDLAAVLHGLGLLAVLRFLYRHQVRRSGGHAPVQFRYGPISFGRLGVKDETTSLRHAGLMVDENFDADDVSVGREHASQLLLVHGLRQIGDEHVGVFDLFARCPICPSTVCDFDAFVFKLHPIQFVDGFDRILGFFVIDEPVTERVSCSFISHDSGALHGSDGLK